VELSGPDVLASLRRRIEEIEARRRPRDGARVSSGMGALDALLPGGGLRPGLVVELVSATDGSGAWTLGLALARRACGERRVLVVVDEQGAFYPLAAARLGLDLERCLVVRPVRGRDAYAALCQSLFCAAVGAVIAGCGGLGAVDAQRLRAAAERGGSVGLLIRPHEALQAAPCGLVRLLVCPVASGEPTRKVRVEVLRGRGHGQALTLELDDETGAVHPPAVLAPPAPPARAARPSA
jgi:hypothetical protein